MNSFYYRVRNKALRILGLPNLGWLNFPRVIHVDTTNKCGPKYCKGQLCTYCFPQWYIAQGKDHHDDMPMEWIEWILKEINRDGRTLGRICWFFNGDYLCESRGHEICALGKKINPWLKSETFTSGVLTENVDLLIDRNLDNVCFTISAHTRELHKKVHRGDNFENAIKTLKIFLERRYPNQKCEVHMVLTKHNYMYAQEWWNFFGQFEGAKRIISPIVYSCDNIPAIKSVEGLTMDMQDEVVLKVAGATGRMWMRHLTPDLKPCNVWDDMTITVHGAIRECCNWLDYRTWNYGFIQDLMKEGRSLKSVWLEKMANKMRNPLCRSCNQKTPDWQQRLDAIKIDAKVKT